MGGEQPRVAFWIVGEKSISMLGATEPFAEMIQIVFVCALDFPEGGVLQEGSIYKLW